MKRLIAAVAAIVVAGCATDAPFQPSVSPPDTNGWTLLEQAGACGLMHEGGLAVGTTDGRNVGFVIKAAVAGPRLVAVDGQTETVSFVPEADSLIGAVTPAMFSRLGSGKTLMIQADNGVASFPAPGADALGKLIGCGLRVGERRLAAERRLLAMQAFAQGLANAGQALQNSSPAYASGGQVGGGLVCYKKGEWTSGLNKNCVYNCLGSDAVQTIGMAQMCPLTMSR